MAREVTGKSCWKPFLGRSGARPIFCKFFGVKIGPVYRSALCSRWDTLQRLFLAARTFFSWNNFFKYSKLEQLEAARRIFVDEHAGKRTRRRYWTIFGCIELLPMFLVIQYPRHTIAAAFSGCILMACYKVALSWLPGLMVNSLSGSSCPRNHPSASPPLASVTWM